MPFLFDDRIDAYVAHRPEYPAELFVAMLEGLRPRVDAGERPIRAADVGCGTGISARGLRRAGAEVIAFDPSPAMVDRARRETEAAGVEGLDFRRGAAEALPLEAGSLDLILCAQSFHWFDAPRALAEFHRVLRPGGRLALLWNRRDDDDAISRAYDAIVRRAQDAAEAAGTPVRRAREADPTTTGRFAGLRRHRAANPQLLGSGGLIGRSHSASYWPPPGPLRAALDAEVAALVARQGEEGAVRLGQVAELTLAERVDDGA